jgi:thiopurine S-methyltransferase
MKKEFWHERWENNQIGFHQEDINPHLRGYWKFMELDPGSLVFVPMCGKSLDMVWLREQGHKVLGVELSPRAVDEFFRQFEHPAEQYASGKFNVCTLDGISILCGDFFDLDRAIAEDVAAVYDRASLIALPAEMRRSYVGHLVNILPPATSILLITTEYAQHEMSGPPFSVLPDEVDSLFSRYGNIERLHSSDVLSTNPGFRSRGLSALVESVYRISLHPR